MIKVNRSPKPATLVNNEARWLRELLAATTKEDKHRAENKYRHREVKEALKSMFHGKCAYCESKIVHIDYGHIEHYKPKGGIYRDLTFEWSNLLLACGICNGSEYKGTKFPLAADGGPFVNPCDDQPADHFEFIYDERAKLATVVGKTTRGVTTERTIGLNRTDLREFRTKYVQMVLCVKELAKTDPEAAEILRQAKLDDSQYAAFARTL